MFYSPGFNTSLWLLQTRMLLNAQTVIALRMMGMAGLLPMQPKEMNRMVAEKGPAFFKAMVGAQTAAIAGKRPDGIIIEAIKPLSRTASANRKRLSRPRKR